MQNFLLGICDRKNQSRKKKFKPLKPKSGSDRKRAKVSSETSGSGTAAPDPVETQRPV